MAEELQQENIFVYALSTAKSRIECASSGSFYVTLLLKKKMFNLQLQLVLVSPMTWTPTDKNINNPHITNYRKIFSLSK